MDFFEAPSPPPGSRLEAREAPRQDWMGPRRGALPAVVAAERVIARTDEVAVSLGCLWVYPTGFEFDVLVDARDEWSELDPFGLDRRLGGRDQDETSPGRLLLGFQFGDGAKVTSVEEWAGRPRAESPSLLGKGARRSGGHSRHSYWLWPLPPPGPLEFVCEWPAAGIPLTRSELDSAAIVEAASRAQTMSPETREALQ